MRIRNELRTGASISALNQERENLLVWDNFDRADTSPGNLGVPAIGDAWQLAEGLVSPYTPIDWLPNTHGRISGHRFVEDSGAVDTVYAYQVLPSIPGRMGASFRFIAGAGVTDYDTFAMAISLDPSYILNMAVHFYISRTNWTLQYRNGGDFVEVASSSLSWAIGSTHYVELFVGDNTVIVDVDGTRTTVTDSHINALKGPYVFWEIYRGVGADLTDELEIESVWAGKSANPTFPTRRDIMQIRNDLVAGIPSYDLDPDGSSSPWVWYGSRALDGTIAPWASAPLMSEYIYNVAGSTSRYVKRANNGATADWGYDQMADGSGQTTDALNLTANSTKALLVGLGLTSETLWVDNTNRRVGVNIGTNPRYTMQVGPSGAYPYALDVTTTPVMVIWGSGVGAALGNGQLMLQDVRSAADTGGTISFGTGYSAGVGLDVAGISGKKSAGETSGGYLQFWTRPDTSTPQEAARFDSKQNLQIGQQIVTLSLTTTPRVMIWGNGGNSPGDGQVVIADIKSATADSGGTISFSAGYSATAGLTFAGIGGRKSVGQTSGGYMTIWTRQDLGNQVEGMRMDSQQRIVMGQSRTTPFAQLSVSQMLTTSNLPVLYMDQKDVNEAFIRFVGVSSDNVENSVIGLASVATSYVSGYVKVSVNDTTGVVSGNYYMPVYTIG